MKRTLLAALCLAVAAPLTTFAAAEGFTSIFDGKSLDGWEGSAQVFRVIDDAIVGGTLEHGLPHNEFLCTRRPYGDFELRLKFKILGDKANAGVQFRSERVPNHHEVRGYQADLASGFTGAIWDEARRNKALAKPEPVTVSSIKLDEWNEYVIRCEGARIQLWINGIQTADYTETDADIPRSGIIGLQIHGGGPSEAWYKDIEIKPL